MTGADEGVVGAGADDWVGAGVELLGLAAGFLAFLAFRFGLAAFLVVVVLIVDEVEDVVCTTAWLVLPGLLLLLLPHPAVTRATAMAEIRTRFIRPPL